MPMVCNQTSGRGGSVDCGGGNPYGLVELLYQTRNSDPTRAGVTQEGHKNANQR